VQACEIVEQRRGGARTRSEVSLGWVFALVGAVVFARIALIYGHHFWFNVLRALRARLH
jgi:hypothetical protein